MLCWLAGSLGVGSWAPHCPVSFESSNLVLLSVLPDFIPSTCAPLRELLHFCTQHFVTSHGVCRRKGCHFLWLDSDHGSYRFRQVVTVSDPPTFMFSSFSALRPILPYCYRLLCLSCFSCGLLGAVDMNNGPQRPLHRSLWSHVEEFRR